MSTFCAIIQRATGMPCLREFRFHHIRRWRFDYAIPAARVAIEVEGGAWTRGRHTRGKGFLNDIEKYNAATLLGWRVFRTAPDALLSAAFIEMVTVACITADAPNPAPKPF